MTLNMIPHMTGKIAPPLVDGQTHSTSLHKHAVDECIGASELC